MDKIEKIRQKIEELYDGEAPKHDQQCDFSDGYFTGLSVISNFLDTLSEEPDTPEFPETFEICLYDGRTPNKENCNECSTTCSVRKEEPDKSLEEEVKNYFQGYWPGTETVEQCNTDLHFTPPAIIRFARHFAEWQKEQMLKGAEETELYWDGDFLAIDLNMAALGYSERDKVRIIVLKEEEE